MQSAQQPHTILEREDGLHQLVIGHLPYLLPTALEKQKALPGPKVEEGFVSRTTRT